MVQFLKPVYWADRSSVVNEGALQLGFVSCGFMHGLGPSSAVCPLLSSWGIGAM